MNFYSKFMEINKPIHFLKMMNLKINVSVCIDTCIVVNFQFNYQVTN